MGRQVNFYFTPIDLLNFEQALKERLSFKILPSRMHTPHLEFLPSMEVGRMGETPLDIFLVHPDDLGKVVLREIPQQAYWTIDSLRSPVMECSRCYFDGRLLRRGRVYYQSGFYREDEWLEKPKSFIAWADSILAVARRISVKNPWGSDYVGPDAAALRAEEKIELRSM